MRSRRLLILGIILLSASLYLPTLAKAAVSAATITGSDQLLEGFYAAGQNGDIVLRNDDIVIVVSAIGHTTHGGENGGTIIDAGTVAGNIDGLGELYTYFDDNWPRQAVYTALNIVADGSGGSAVVRATGHDLNDPSITVTTDYSLANGDRYLTLTTSITASATPLPNFELGDAFHWGSSNKYAPGYGFSVSGTTTHAWMAGLATGVCYAYGGVDGDCWGPNGGTWSDLSVTTADFSAGETVSYIRYLAVTEGEIAAATAVLYQAIGTTTGTANCTVTNLADGLPLGGVALDVYFPTGEPLLQMSTDGAGFGDASLPPGTWRIEATVSGFSAVEQDVAVAGGGIYNLDFQMTAGSGGGGTFALGDTLTIIQRPLVNLPSFVVPGETLAINCAADPATTGWQAEISHDALTVPLPISSATYDADTEWWTLNSTMPVVPLAELYDLRVTANGGLDDTTRNAVRVLDEFKDDFYFMQITDVHLPDHQFSSSGGTPQDSTETLDLREVIKDINLINPEFVLITGDFINEGELEDYLEWRAYSRAQRQLYEFETPSFLIAGNHDIGGWNSTPPPAGTARRNWWRFFGWPRLNDPPIGAPSRTQNYSFDYGSLHVVGLESYDNYDLWRSGIYGADSFPLPQLNWLTTDLAAATGSAAQVLFYHYDFQNQLNLNTLGVEMALWGHIHSDNGSVAAQPYDLATNNVCDGERSYRLIRYHNGVLQPELTMSAGATGQNLRVQYLPSNTGAASTVTAQVTNNQPQRFERGQLRFVMPASGGAYTATGGEIKQVDTSGDFDVCYVAVDMLANSTLEVTVSPGLSDVPSPANWQDLRLGANEPNPFNPATKMEYTLPTDGLAKIAVYDIHGREVAVLSDEHLAAGDYEIFWRGVDNQGRAMASGVYLVRLDFGGQVRSRKVVLAR